LRSAFQPTESGAQRSQDVDPDLEELAPVPWFWRIEDELGKPERGIPLDELGNRTRIAPRIEGFVERQQRARERRGVAVDLSEVVVEHRATLSDSSVELIDVGDVDPCVPRVSHACRHLGDARAVASEGDRQAGGLHTSGRHRRVLVLGELAVEVAEVTAQQLVDDSRALFESIDTLFVGNLEGRTPHHELVVDLSAAEPEDETTVTQLVDRHGEPRDMDGVSPRQIRHHHAEFKILRLTRQRAESDPRIEQRGSAITPIPECVADPGSVELGVLHPHRKVAAVLMVAGDDVDAEGKVRHAGIVPQDASGRLVDVHVNPSAVLVAVVIFVSSVLAPTSVDAGDPEPQPKVARIAAVGDIACDPQSPYIDVAGYCQHDVVGKLVHGMVRRGTDWFFTLGDAQYEYGTYHDFRAEFHPAFKAVRSVTKAIAGNHEYYTDHARGHFRYWGRHAGSRQQPWRTFTPVRGWRVIFLDSQCEHVGGCGARSPQGRWLRQLLSDNTKPCTLAMWHHPLRSSGEYAGSADSQARAEPLWRMSNRGGVDVVLNGHDHIYERFAKRSDMQQFTVGTGGKNHYAITTKAPGSRKRYGHRYGVLRLDLVSNGSYRHAFVSSGGDVLDKGSVSCTNEPVTSG
jgi:hypothetical protein